MNGPGFSLGASRSLTGPFSFRAALLILFAFAAIPPLIFSGFLLQRYAENERVRAETNLQESAKGLARAIDAQFVSTEAVLMALSFSPRLATNDLAGFEPHLRAVAEQTGHPLKLVDPDGHIVLSTVETGEDFVPYKGHPSDKTVISNITRSTANALMVIVVVPVKNGGAIRWTLQAMMRPADFRPVIQQPGFPTDWVFSVSDQTGLRFLRSRRNEEASGQRLRPDLLNRLQEREAGVIRTTSLEGLALVSTIAAAPRSGWIATVGLPEGSLTDPYRQQLGMLLAFGVPVTIAALGAALLLAAYLARVMSTLTDLARAAGASDRPHFEPTLLSDANSVGQALQETAAELTARRQELTALNSTLEDQVIARTAQLMETNARLQDEIARRQASEAQLRQSQKMEAVGQLTGGIAHDFNNMLAVILSSLNLLRRRLARGETKVEQYVEGAIGGAERAANLVRRLLAFSRQHPLSPETVDANKMLAGMEEVLRRTIPESISIEMVHAGGLWRSFADIHGLENVIVNLAVNARDAMPDGGKLTLETANAYLDEAYAASHDDVTPGQYVMIAVTDTGKGMTPDVAARVFEPFFTTKPPGAGTGLGLSQVYGYIKQSGGHVKIYSEPGVGTTVKLYLPRSVQEAEATVPARQAILAAHASGARQLVLVVEDDPDVRRLTVDMLSELNYQTLSAENGDSALQLIDAHPDIALIFTDVVMPLMNGRKLADEAAIRRPGVKVLFTTGYTRNAIVHNGVLDEGVHLIVKPFTIESLAQKLSDLFRADAA
jgi:signal transduction histidine kinase/ActR/RegA family two-component response regulator